MVVRRHFVQEELGPNLVSILASYAVNKEIFCQCKTLTIGQGQYVRHVTLRYTFKMFVLTAESSIQGVQFPKF